MIPGLGRALILLALGVAASGAIVGFAVGRRPSPEGRAWTRRFTYAFAALMLLANGVMVFALLTRDFSVGYVAQVGSHQVPNWVAVVSLWSALEGSILFWGAILGVYMAAATWGARDRHPETMPYAAGVWLACGAFFAFLLAGPAQPFATMSIPPPDGPGPNPLLQNHLLMIAHPPFLYLGYVGLTIPFGLASAALLTGRLGHDFLKTLRTWLLMPWIFLTVAVVLGGWWAYEVLGWGGYWAWDPVENASFLPWLTATAALHSLLLVERKGVLKGWTMTLIQASFLLTILGTFMTRSGVFNSVHSFTQSAIGPTLLVFLAGALLFSVALLATRIDRLSSDGKLSGPRSRDGMFLLNNLVLVLFTFTVLLGTVFPLVVEALRDVQMSVGRPYFDRMAVPLGVALLLLMGVGPALPWGVATNAQLKKALLPPLLGAALFTVLGWILGARNGWTIVTLAFGGYTAQVTLRELWLPLKQRLRRQGLGQAIAEAQRSSRRRIGAYVVHAGVVLIIIAIAVSSTMGTDKEVQLRAGESFALGRYQVRFLEATEMQEPHRASVVARLEVSRDGHVVGLLEPRMNHYATQREPVGTPAVRTGFGHDLYLSILNVDTATQTLALHALLNPMVGWIWIATGVMALGGVMALLPARRRQQLPLAAPAVPAGAVVERP